MPRLAIASSLLLVCGLGEKCSGEESSVGRKLEIVSAPKGATVEVDGVRKGKTPLTLKNLDVERGQRQTITFELEGYKPVEKTLRWRRAEQSLSATLEKLARRRSITVESDPDGATVYADGEPKGETPTRWSMELENGTEVNILVQKEGYVDISEKVTFEEEKSKNLEYELRKSGGLEAADLDEVLLRYQRRWRRACKAEPTDVCKFGYSVNEEGDVDKVKSVSCSDPRMDECTKKLIGRMRFPAAEQGREDNFTWYGL